MSDQYRQLLEATIAHVEDLRNHGVRFVPVASDTLPALLNDRPAPPPTRRPPATSHSNPAPVPDQPIAMRRSSSTSSASANATVPLAALATRPRPLAPEQKVSELAAFRQRVLTCNKCAHLASARTQVVFGVGDANARLMFVGEAPGADEDAQGEPFVGKAGQLLTKIIQTMGLSRETVYIANILKCRPDTPGQTAGNRKPTPSEMVTCLPYLLEQIDIIQPQVIVALGATAIEGLFGKSEGITRLRGRWLAFRDTPVMPTYHPAYLLRNQASSEKRKVWEDMLAVMVKLAMPISEKQRGFFLKA